MIIVTIVSLTIVASAIFWAPLRNIFHFSLIDWSGLLFAIIAAGITAVWLEGLKVILPNVRTAR